MNDKEITEIQNEMWRSCQETSKWKLAWDYPVPQTYNSGKEGISLLIEKSTISEFSIHCLEAIVEKHKLKMMESEGFLVIYTPRIPNT